MLKLILFESCKYTHLSLMLIVIIFCPGALRFMRRIIGLKDEFYNRYIMRNFLFEPVIKAFLNNGSRYNLMNSAIIEMFEYVRVVSIALIFFDSFCWMLNSLKNKSNCSGKMCCSDIATIHKHFCYTDLF